MKSGGVVTESDGGERDRKNDRVKGKAVRVV